ncbi:MAG: cobalamin-dependent protein [Deltaproteobacteria bacterium]|nr:cobalamin-dependent protein [Deltaproteobacteria bacterium]
MSQNTRKLRVLIAKPGLDGHDKGAKVVAAALRDAGMEVVYTGRRQTVKDIVNAAMQEAVDIIGLSILSGVHLEACEELFRLLRENKMDDVRVVVGGVIPKEDDEELLKLGVAEVFHVGTSFEAITSRMREIAQKPN